MWYLYYKRIIALAKVLNYAPSVINYAPWVMFSIVASLTDDSRGIIYNNNMYIVLAGNTKGGSITVPLTSCLTGLESAVWQLTIFVFICKTD
jgi:hypothetical protein